MHVKELVLDALLSAILVVSKEVLSFLPNIEIVTCLLMVYTSVFSLKDSLWISFLFCLVQTLLYGIGTWTPVYFVIWPLFCCLFSLSKPILEKKVDYVALFGDLFGLLFGSFFAVPYLWIGGFQGFIAYLLNGLVFDCIHAVSNYILILLLYEPLKKSCQRLYTLKR